MNLLPFHIGLMGASAASMAAAIAIARYFRKKKWWLKLHKSLNLAAVGLALAGLAVAAVMVQSSGGPHFRVGHALIGGGALILVLGVPGLGFLIFKSKDKARTARLRLVHRWMGRLTAILYGAAAVAGLILIGVI